MAGQGRYLLSDDKLEGPIISVPKGGKQLAGQINGLSPSRQCFSSHMVIEQTSVGGTMDMRVTTFIPVSFDGMTTRLMNTIVPSCSTCSTMPTWVGDRYWPSPLKSQVLSKTGVAGLHHRSSVESAVFPDMIVDEAHPLVCRRRCRLHKVDPVGEIDRSCPPGAIVADATAWLSIVVAPTRFAAVRTMAC